MDTYKKISKHFLKCYEMLRLYGLGYRVQGSGFGVQGLGLGLKFYKMLRVQGLGFRVYNTLGNSFHKHLNKKLQNAR